MSEPDIRTVDECVGCTDVGLHCLGSTCPYIGTVRVVCHRCRDEAGDTLYRIDGELMGERWEDDDAWVCYDCLRELADERDADTDDLILETRWLD